MKSVRERINSFAMAIQICSNGIHGMKITIDQVIHSSHANLEDLKRKRIPKRNERNTIMFEEEEYCREHLV